MSLSTIRCDMPAALGGQRPVGITCAYLPEQRRDPPGVSIAVEVLLSTAIHRRPHHYDRRLPASTNFTDWHSRWRTHDVPLQRTIPGCCRLQLVFQIAIAP